jgi:hypothetical protein
MLKRTAVAAWLLAGAALAESPLYNAKAYIGTDGARAVVAMVKPAEQSRCLLYVTGTLAEIDSLVLPCTWESTGAQPRIDYHFTKAGRGRTAAQGFASGQLDVFGRGNVIYKLKYDDAETQKLKVDDLWAKHQAQKKELDALARFDRASEVAEQGRNVQKALAGLNKSCGTQMTADLDSSPLSDAEFMSTSFESYCVAAVEEIRWMCEQWRVARTTFQQKLKRIECRPGPVDLKLSLNGTTLNVETNARAGDLSNELEAWLRENL